MTPTWTFISAILGGSGAAVIVSLIFIGRYQEKVNQLEKDVPELAKDVKTAITGVARLEGEVSRMNGRGHD
jgi:hypothetical protein